MEAPAWERTPQEFKAVSCWKVWSSTIGRLQIIRILYMPESILDLITYYTAMYACICVRVYVCHCVMNSCADGFLCSKIAADNSLYSHPLPSMSYSSGATSTKLITIRLDCFYRLGLHLSRVWTDYLKHGQVVVFLPLASSEHPPASPWDKDHWGQTWRLHIRYLLFIFQAVKTEPLVLFFYRSDIKSKWVIQTYLEVRQTEG